MILTDTGYWLALANTRDRHHQRSIEVSRQIDSELITTWSVITETCHLLANRVNKLASIRFLQVVRLGVTLC